MSRSNTGRRSVFNDYTTKYRRFTTSRAINAIPVICLSALCSLAAVEAQGQAIAPPALDRYTAAERAIHIFTENAPQLDGSGLSSNVLPAFKIPLDPPVVNLQSRDEVLGYYHGAFGMTSKWWADWANGDLDGCIRGTTTRGYQESMIARMNWWRGMAGRPVSKSFKLDAEYSRMAQEASMLLDASNFFTHTPSPNAKCFSALGAQGARGNVNPNNMPDGSSIDGFISDSGAGNEFAGHRSSMLYIDQRAAGVGTTYTRPNSIGYQSLLGETNGNSVVPIKATMAVVSYEQTSFPSAGYTLHNLLPGSGRWEYQDTTLYTATAASVTLTKNGVNVPVNVSYRTGGEEFNYARIVWELPLSMTRNALTRLNSGSQDDVYEVTITGLTQMNRAPAPTVKYTVTAINGFPGHPDWNGDQRAVAVSEFYVPSQDTYFISQSREDATILDREASSALYRTWRGFYAWPSSEASDAGSVPVCRWFFKAPRSTHFYSAKASDCELVKQVYGNRTDVAVEESTTAFYVMPVNVSGVCDEKYQPVYRLYNKREAQDKPNHRYLVHPGDRRELMARGWSDEGIAWCSPRKKENYWLESANPSDRDWQWN